MRADDDAVDLLGWDIDPYLGALAVTHGARLATAGRGFARSPGLRLGDRGCPT